MVALAHYSDRDRLYSELISTDVPALVNFSNDATWLADALQLLGEAVLVVAARKAHQIEPAARRCATELRERDWGGDAELADQIDAALAWGPPSALRLVGSR